MNIIDEETINLFYVGLKHYLGKAVSDAQKEAGHDYLNRLEQHERMCAFCGKFVKYKERSIDHIIPKKLCWELGLYRFVIDRRNFRLAHKVCNARRSSDVSDLPPKVLEKLIELGYSRDG